MNFDFMGIFEPLFPSDFIGEIPVEIPAGEIPVEIPAGGECLDELPF